MKIFLILLIIAFSLCVQNTATSETNLVVYVVDGDTIDLENGESIRLIGINAPERGEDCYYEATTKLEGLVLNKNVRLEKDVRDADIYDRSLRYVYIGNLFVNLEIVRTGYAYADSVEPDVKYSNQITDAEAFAEQNKIGCLWN